MDRFRLKEETLSDGSLAYAVEFDNDYDDRVISLDCMDRATAQALITAMEDGVANVAIRDA